MKLDLLEPGMLKCEGQGCEASVVHGLKGNKYKQSCFALSFIAVTKRF